MVSRQWLVVGSAIGLLAAAFGIKKLLEEPEVRHRLGLNKSANADEQIEMALEDSFPASDPPSWTATSLS